MDEHVQDIQEDVCQSSESPVTSQARIRSTDSTADLARLTDHNSEEASETSSRSRQILAKTRSRHISPLGSSIEYTRPEAPIEVSSPYITLPATIVPPEPVFKIPTSRRSDYSRYLPPYDLSNKSEAFFADLKSKRIIAGYDEDRFSCWCHVAKKARNPDTQQLSCTHVQRSERHGLDQRYCTSFWFSHVSRCDFYKVSFLVHLFQSLIFLQNPWATSGPSGRGKRKFPQFPLPEPIATQREAVDHLRSDDVRSAFEKGQGEKRRRLDVSEGQTTSEDPDAIDPAQQSLSSRGRASVAGGKRVSQLRLRSARMRG
jgi:hypothetical protein